MALTKVIGAGLGTVTDNADFDGTLNVQGETTLQTHLNMGDNDQIKLGAGADLAFYHDGSNSYITEGGTGSLYALTNSFVLRNAANSESMLTATENGAVELFHNDSKKFETDSSGVTVTGNVISNDGSNNARFQFDNNNQILIENDSALYLYVNGSASLKVDSIGAVTKPNQPAFLAQPTSTINNLNSGANNSIVFGTERFDQNADYDASSGVFTAPVTGKYMFNVTFYLNNIDSAAGYYEPRLDTSNRSYYVNFDPDFGQDNSYFTICFHQLVDMDANDTADINIHQNGGSSQTDISAASTFSMYLVC